MATILRASQDAKRLIQIDELSDGSKYSIYNENFEELFSKKSTQKIIDCDFFPHEFGYVIALGYDIKNDNERSIGFVQEKTNAGGKIAYEDLKLDTNIDSDIPPFESQLRVSRFPPELNIGYISRDQNICIFFVDCKFPSIQLIPLRRYYAETKFLWFNFTDNNSIWCVKGSPEGNENQIIIGKYKLNSFEMMHTKAIAFKGKFVDASISAIKIEDKQRIAILTNDGFFYTGLLPIEENKIIENCNVKQIMNPTAISWSPFGVRLGITTLDRPYFFVESSYNKWSPIEYQKSSS